MKEFAQKLNQQLNRLFSDMKSGISAREDSRAFGAMIEKRITENWRKICSTVGCEYVENPGRRAIYDFAWKFRRDGYRHFSF